MIRIKSAFLPSVLAAATIVASLGTARAATITVGNSLGPASTNINTTLPVAQFNPASGTLTSVQVAINDAVTATWGYENFLNTFPVSGGNLTINSDSAAVNISGPVGLSLPLSQTVTGFVYTVPGLPAYDGVFDLAGASGGTFSPLISLSSNTSGTFTTPVDLATFTGLGNVNYSVVATGSVNFSPPNQVTVQVRTRASAGVLVTYTYNPVPEPASLAMAGMGFAGLCAYAAARRRNRKRSA